MVPDFLCIGAQKSGTTWLRENLIQHPGIWMPPVSELHYFDRSIRTPSPLNPRFFNRRWRIHLKQRFRQSVRDGLGARDLLWDMRFFFGYRSDDWYASLFEPGEGYCTGEVTPAYSMLAVEEVAHIHNLIPEARILFVMRDPIDRAWSALRMAVDRRGLDLSDVKSWTKFLDRQKTARGDYLRSLRIWRRYYSDERMMVGFFDEIAGDPAEFLMRVHRFLSLESGPEFVPPTVSQRFNVGSVRSIPFEIEAYLARMYVDDLRELSLMFGAPVGRWLSRAERILGSS